MLNILDPKFILFAIVGGFFPALVWLFFWLREDNRRPEPIGLILRTFLLGGLFVFLAFILQRSTVPLMENAYNLSFDLSNPGWSWGFFFASVPFLLVWAFIEEIVKFLATVIAAFSSKSFDEPIDAMVYIITAAIGFAAIENTFFLINTLTSGENNLYFILTGNLRFLGATVVHIVSSAVVGGAIALTFCSSVKKRILTFVFGLIIATLLHTIFNFFIIVSSTAQMFKIFLVLWVAAILVIYFFERVKRIVCMPNFKVTKSILNN
ncbi:MAG: PrsW family intramembrane metalloprotease [Candidatus Vogelbacteria bacterium]|nr:PrsW family intramembrane metalloprotease [Candidatus Vogelbacteria bacterium]